MAAGDHTQSASAQQAAIAIANSKGIVKFASPAMARLSGGGERALTGLSLDSLFHEGDATLIRQGLESIANHRSLSALLEVRTRATGEPARLELQLALDSRGKPAGIIAMVHGASGGRRSPFAPGAAGIALIEKFGAELNAALEGLRDATDHAQRAEFDAALVDHFHGIRDSTQEALAAIGDLVDFAELEGGIVLHRAEFRLRAAIAEVVGRIVHLAEERRSQLRLKIDQAVPDLLEGDLERLQLVLRNLLENALAVAGGTATMLEITPGPATKSGIALSFAVTVVTGGAAGTTVPGTPSRTRTGVAVAHYVIGAMGGEWAGANVPAEPPYRFTIPFPACRSPSPPRRPTYVSLVAMRALVVSEDASQRQRLSTLLRGWRMNPLEADSASMAIALLERLVAEGKSVPFVLVASRMSAQDGFLLGFRLQNHPQIPATLVMMLADEGKPGDAVACNENGIAAYLRYPLADKQLYDAIVAVTGASTELEETPTLVTRHSLREQRKGATILLVDAQREAHYDAAHILRKRDSSLTVATNLADALQCLAQEVYELVFVDTGLAGLDGPDAVQTLRGHMMRDPDATRIYAVSADASPAYRDARRAEGFDGTIAKPFRSDALLATLAAVGKFPDSPE